ncbi:MAG TPA: 50S ribosomal protein L20 [Terriglobia bacterium]|nr:50S ribosomal protein L20 [Terriglobia bacterium]
MPRVKRGTVRRANRQKLSKLTKGYFLTKGKLYRSMREAADRAGRFAYRDRRRRKRDFRRLWIVRISAAARLHDLTYSQLIHGLKTLGVELDRKMLSEMAAQDAPAFAELVAKVKEVLPAPAASAGSAAPAPEGAPEKEA